MWDSPARPAIEGGFRPPKCATEPKHIPGPSEGQLLAEALGGLLIRGPATELSSSVAERARHGVWFSD